MKQITDTMIFWAILSPVLSALGVGLINYLLNYRVIQVKNQNDHERIEHKADGLGKSFDEHCRLQQEREVALSKTLGRVEVELKLLVEGKINK